jgi:hypothetical protein
VPLALALVAAAGAAEVPLQPFVIDHRGRPDSAADVSFLLDPPAGREGFIRVKDGHLARPDGRRFRIWGVNLTGWTRGSTLLPPKEDAGLWARALARAGIDCVRFHFLDMPTQDPAKEDARTRPAGLISRDRDDTQAFDPDALDRLDFFVAELKRQGIYSDLNLNVGRTYKAGDRVPDSEVIRITKGMTYIGERMLELQRDYARQLLTHRNPYTGAEYRHEPAIAIVEIVNENSLLEFWMRNWLRGELVPGGPRYELDFTPYYERKLTEGYQRWLGRNRTPAEIARLREQAGVGPGAPVPRLRREEFGRASKERFYAEASFYCDVERDFFTGMRSYLKGDLGVESLIVGNADHTYRIPDMPMLRANSLMDIVDAHVYWQHPAISGARDTPMVNEPLQSTIVRLSRSPFLGKPFTVSEVNHPNPNEYGAEMIPILAAYGAFQDWDGIFLYTFEPKAGNHWQPFVADPFDITLDPVKMVQMGVGALLFTRPDVAAARRVAARTYSAEQVNESMRLPESERPYFTPGYPVSLALRHEARIRCLDCAPTGTLADDPAPPYLSDTGELGWYGDKDKGGLVTIDTDRTQGLVGFVRDGGRSTRHLAAEVKNDFCALTLSSLTPEPIARSPTLLLTACSRWQNTGSTWNERHTLWSEWGSGPTLIEPVTGWLVLRELEGAVALRLVPLDGAARPIGEPIAGRRLDSGWEVPLGRPATGLYLVRVMR